MNHSNPGLKHLACASHHAQSAIPGSSSHSSPTYVVDLSRVDPASLRTWPKGEVVLSGLVLHGPLYFGGGSLGLGPLDTCTDIIDSTGLRVTTESVETVPHGMLFLASLRGPAAQFSSKRAVDRLFRT